MQQLRPGGLLLERAGRRRLRRRQMNHEIEFSPKLRRARSRLHRRRFLQVNTCWKALDEIYKIYIYASLGEKNRIENEIMKMYTNKKYSTEKAE